MECDCGYVASGGSDAELVADAQAHANQSHGLDLPAELILVMASPDESAPLRATGGERLE